MAEYIALTKDDEVSIKEEVEIDEIEQIERKRTLTLDLIDAQINEIDGIVSRQQAKRIELEALRALVDTEASKIALKV